MFIPFHANRSLQVLHTGPLKEKQEPTSQSASSFLLLVWTAKWKRTLCAQHMHVVFISFVYWDLNPNRYASCPTADPSPPFCLWPCRAACLTSFADVQLSKSVFKRETLQQAAEEKLLFFFFFWDFVNAIENETAVGATSSKTMEMFNK